MLASCVKSSDDFLFVIEGFLRIGPNAIRYVGDIAIPCPLLRIDEIIQVVMNSSMDFCIKLGLIFLCFENCPLSANDTLVAAVDHLVSTELTESAIDGSILFQCMVYNFPATKKVMLDWITKNNIKQNVEDIILDPSFPSTMPEASVLCKIILLCDANMLSEPAVNKLMDCVLDIQPDVSSIGLMQACTIYAYPHALNKSKVQQFLENMGDDAALLGAALYPFCEKSKIPEFAQAAYGLAIGIQNLSGHSIFDSIAVESMYHCMNYEPITADVLPYLLQYAYQKRPVSCTYKVACILRQCHTQFNLNEKQKAKVKKILGYLPFLTVLSDKCKLADVSFQY